MRILSIAIFAAAVMPVGAAQAQTPERAYFACMSTHKKVSNDQYRASYIDSMSYGVVTSNLDHMPYDIAQVFKKRTSASAGTDVENTSGSCSRGYSTKEQADADIARLVHRDRNQKFRQITGVNFSY